MKHALAVEAAVRGYARTFGEDETAWGVVALLHDFDYERWPSREDHPYRGVEILRDLGYPGVGDACHPVARRLQRRAPREPAREDAVRVRRTGRVRHRRVAGSARARSILDLEAASVIRRMKDKAFARAVKRDDLRAGAELLGLPLDQHITNVIGFMREQADALGLRGNL